MCVCTPTSKSSKFEPSNEVIPLKEVLQILLTLLKPNINLLFNESLNNA